MIVWTSQLVGERLREAAKTDFLSPVGRLRPDTLVPGEDGMEVSLRSSWPTEGVSWTHKDLYVWKLEQADKARKLEDWEKDPRGPRPEGPEKVSLRPAIPSGRDIDRMTEALGWMILIPNIPERRVVHAWAYMPYIKLWDEEKERRRKMNWRDICDLGNIGTVRTAQRVMSRGVAIIAVELGKRKAA